MLGFSLGHLKRPLRRGGFALLLVALSLPAHLGTASAAPVTITYLSTQNPTGFSLSSTSS